MHAHVRLTLDDPDGVPQSQHIIRWDEADAQGIHVKSSLLAVPLP